MVRQQAGDPVTRRGHAIVNEFIAAIDSLKFHNAKNPVEAAQILAAVTAELMALTMPQRSLAESALEPRD